MFVHTNKEVPKYGANNLEEDISKANTLIPDMNTTEKSSLFECIC